jgi:nucleoid-associated protein YgaU
MAVRQEDLLAERDAAVVAFPTHRARVSTARRNRMEARRRRTAAVATVLSLVVVFMLATGPGGSAPASAPGAPRSVTIHQGDTLWSLAEAYAPAGMDLRAYVDALEDLNGLDGTLAAGQRIKLPR